MCSKACLCQYPKHLPRCVLVLASYGLIPLPIARAQPPASTGGSFPRPPAGARGVLTPAIMTTGEAAGEEEIATAITCLLPRATAQRHHLTVPKQCLDINCHVRHNHCYSFEALLSIPFYLTLFLLYHYYNHHYYNLFCIVTIISFHLYYHFDCY